MINNDQGAHHLLIWINRQQQQIAHQQRIYSFQQIKDSPILRYILNKINHQYFTDLSNMDLNYKAYFICIEKYLSQVEDLSFKKVQRQQLVQNQQISELVKLILYLTMKNKVKEEFVNRILQLQEETQMYLMQQIKRVHGWLQSKMEFNEVYQSISQLQQQNETLNKRLLEIKFKKEQAQNIRAQLERENITLQQQNRMNIDQKNLIIQELGISQPSDYLTMYRNIIAQRNDLVMSYESYQQINEKIAQQNQDLREKIVEDALIIDHLNTQISKYKQLYSRLRRNSQLINDCSILQISSSKQCQMTLSSTQTIKYLGKEQSMSTQSISTTPYLQLDQDDVSLTIQNYNQDLLSKLQAMYTRIGKLNTQISELNAQNQMTKKENRRKQKIIARAFQSFQNHTTDYSKTLTA